VNENACQETEIVPWKIPISVGMLSAIRCSSCCNLKSWTVVKETGYFFPHKYSVFVFVEFDVAECTMLYMYVNHPVFIDSRYYSCQVKMWCTFHDEM